MPRVAQLLQVALSLGYPFLVFLGLRILEARAVALVLGACGETGPLEGVGDRTGAWVTAATLPTTSSPPVVIEVGEEGLVGATDTLWVNDDIGPAQPHDDPQAMIATVWNRQLGSR